MSTCVGAAPPHEDCPHGKRCDWKPPLTTVIEPISRTFSPPPPTNRRDRRALERLRRRKL